MKTGDFQERGCGAAQPQQLRTGLLRLVRWTQPRSIIKGGALLCLGWCMAALLSLCGCKHEHDHAHADGGHSHGGDHGHSHGDDAESFSGATFKEGEGITLLDQTRKLLGIQTAEVVEQTLPREIRFITRVYSAKDRLALGMVPPAEATVLRAGQTVRLRTAPGVAATGEVQRVSTPLTNHDAEVIVSFARDTPSLDSGEFAEAGVSVPGDKPALVIPRESVIRGAMGDLVYAVNGDAYVLTWVELGAQSGGRVEVTDGLLAGDSVVTRGAMDLWLVELRAQKGGQGCCPAPPKKEKK